MYELKKTEILETINNTKYIKEKKEYICFNGLLEEKDFWLIVAADDDNCLHLSSSVTIFFGDKKYFCTG